ncbi:MAG: 4Fe-4S dicluster domain-containing protein [Rikenellaceae bacterium]
MLRILRIAVAVLFMAMATLLFLDFTGTVHTWFGWVAKVQFLPAALALNFIVVGILLVLTFIFGRLYCSVICPLGIYQDVVSRLNKKRKVVYKKACSKVRYGIFALFVISILAGFASIVTILEPYSAFGRMVSTLLQPIYKLGNNALDFFAERMNSYAFYPTDIALGSLAVFIVSIVTFVVVSRLAWSKGRSYCNSVCPVGTLLSFVSRFSLLKIRIDQEKCNGCTLCTRKCKSACIETSTREIDYSRCVVCFDCIDSCRQGAISFGLRTKTKKEIELDSSKRNMLAVTAALLATQAVKAEEKLVDGGLAVIEDKKVPKRNHAVLPAGSFSARRFSKHCTGCQLCVSVCENNVLRASTSLMKFMQPEMSFELGYCRPECTKCSEVCPAGAIEKIDVAEKSSTQIGRAIYIEKNCVVLTKDVNCGNCATHCPTGAIKMIKPKDEKYNGRKIPMIDTTKCIGCGACEYLCPARPFAAIFVEGYATHRTI